MAPSSLSRGVDLGVANVVPTHLQLISQRRVYFVRQMLLGAHGRALGCHG